MPQWLSILPPILAIAVAIWKKEVILALVTGIWLAEVLALWQANPLADGGLLLVPQLIAQGFMAMIERIIMVFNDAGNVRVLVFGLVVGALLELMRASGGVAGFVNRLARMGLTKSPRQVSALATLTGMAVFVESSMSVLSAGVVSQQLFDKFRMSRARLAFIIDATSSPICVLILLNAWGAYVLQLLKEYSIENPTAVVLGTIPYNFYALFILALVWYTVITGKVHGPMRRAEAAALGDSTADSSKPQSEKATRARYMMLPMAVLIAGMFFFMWYTGKGNFSQGSGSLSVLASVTLATMLAIFLVVKDGVYTYKDSINVVYTGMGKLIPVTMVMLLSFAIGAACKNIGTGPFVASALSTVLPMILVAPLLFICGAIISFTTGTSWGTFAILIPMGMPLAQQMGIAPALALSAILGGGVFGDHCSPISDTTLLSSLASGCDHLEHVKTQLPYALLAGLAATILYLLVGLVGV